MFVAGLLLLLTFFLWKSGSRVQKAIKADADARIAEAQSEGARANERATALELELATQRERTAVAEKELLELRQRLAWRLIPKNEEDDLAHALGLFKGRSISILDESNGDKEAERLAGQLADVFKRADWTVTQGSNTRIPALIGVMLQHNTDDPAAAMLLGHLRSLGFRPTEQIADSTASWFAVKVGVRPPA